MVNDTTTLNGALSELGETLATNLNKYGVSASASDGLTTLANKINQIPETYFIDTLNVDDYILADTTIASVTVENNAIKISNTYNGNKSVVFGFNRSPILDNWKALFKLKTSSEVTLYCRFGGNRTSSTYLNYNKNINYSSFVNMEWIMENGNMSLKADGVEIGTATYTEGMFYPNMAFYFNKNEYALLKDFKIIRI